LAIWDGFVVRTLVQALPYISVKEINAANLESNRKSGGERSLEDEKLSEKYQELMCL
jgi:hypothetical protein